MRPVPPEIDPSLVVGKNLFATHRDRGLYLGKSARDQAKFLKDNPNSWWRIEDVQRQAAPLGSPIESTVDIGAKPAGPDAEVSSANDSNDGADDDVIVG